MNIVKSSISGLADTAKEPELVIDVEQKQLGFRDKGESSAIILNEASGGFDPIYSTITLYPNYTSMPTNIRPEIDASYTVASFKTNFKPRSIIITNYGYEAYTVLDSGNVYGLTNNFIYYLENANRFVSVYSTWENTITTESPNKPEIHTYKELVGVTNTSSSIAPADNTFLTIMHINASSSPHTLGLRITSNKQSDGSWETVISGQYSSVADQKSILHTVAKRVDTLTANVYIF